MSHTADLINETQEKAQERAKLEAIRNTALKTGVSGSGFGRRGLAALDRQIQELSDDITFNVKLLDLMVKEHKALRGETH